MRPFGFFRLCKEEQQYSAGERRLMEVIEALSTKQDQLMSKIDDYIAAQQAFNADIAADFTTIQSNTTALNGQISTLTSELASAGLTDSQSAALDALTAAGAALQSTADAAAGKTAPAAPAAGS